MGAGEVRGVDLYRASLPCPPSVLLESVTQQRGKPLIASVTQRRAVFAHSTSCGARRGQRSKPCQTPRGAVDPLGVGPRRLDESGVREQRRDLFRRLAGVVVVGDAAPEHQRGDVHAARVGVGEARDDVARAAAVRLHPPLHRGDELLRVLGQEAFAVRRVALEHLGPARDGGHRFHATVPHCGDRGRAVVGGQRQEAEHTSADPPHRDRAGHVGMTVGREERHPGSTRASDDHRRCQVELPEQSGEDVGLHLRLRVAAEAHFGLAAVRAVPDHHPIAVLGDGGGELADTRVVLAEATTGRHDPRRSLAHDVVRDRQSLDFCPRHGQTLTRRLRRPR